MTSEKIMFYASAKSGMLAPLDEKILRLCERLVSAGFLRREEKTFTVPAMTGEAARHADACGFGSDAHDTTIVKYYAVAASVAA